jgi:hypothetical protein
MKFAFPSLTPAQAAPWIVSAILLATIFAGSPNFRYHSGPEATPYAGDFLQEWLGGYIVTRGEYARFYDVSYAQQLQHDPSLVGFEWNRSRYLPIVYPPFYYLLISPLSYLSLTVAAWIWSALLIACLVASVLLVGGNKSFVPWLVPAAILFMPTVESLTSCQKGPLCLLILTATFVLLSRGKSYSAGLIFGLLAFKPQLTLVIAFAMLFKREWRFIFGGMTTGAVLVGLCGLLGMDVCRQYFEFSRGTAEYIHTGGYDLTKSHCWYGFFTLLLNGWDAAWIKAATAVACAATLGLLAWLLRGRLDTRLPQFAGQFSGLVLATLLLSPHLYTYDLTILLLPMFLLARTGWGGAGQGSGAQHHVGQASRLPEMVFLSSGRRDAYPTIAPLLIALYALAGISPTLAGLTGIQLTPLLIFALLASIAKRVGQASRLPDTWRWMAHPTPA